MHIYGDYQRGIYINYHYNRGYNNHDMLCFRIFMSITDPPRA